MKKTSFLVFLVLTLLLTACSSTSNSQSANSNKAAGNSNAKWTEDDFSVYYVEDGSLYNFPMNESMSFWEEGKDDIYQTARGVKIGDIAKVKLVDSYDFSGFDISLPGADEDFEKQYFEKYPDWKSAISHTAELVPYKYDQLRVLGDFFLLNDGSLILHCMDVEGTMYPELKEGQEIIKQYSIVFWIYNDEVDSWSVSELESRVITKEEAEEANERIKDSIQTNKDTDSNHGSTEIIERDKTSNADYIVGTWIKKDEIGTDREVYYTFKEDGHFIETYCLAGKEPNRMDYQELGYSGNTWEKTGENQYKITFSSTYANWIYDPDADQLIYKGSYLSGPEIYVRVADDAWKK